jgi:hypothetical protein
MESKAPTLFWSAVTVIGTALLFFKQSMRIWWSDDLTHPENGVVPLLPVM